MRRKLCLNRAGTLAAAIMLTVSAAAADDVVSGAFALVGAEQTVTAQMTVNETGPLSIALTLNYADVHTGEPVRDFSEELTQELHLLAIDSSLTRLVHEHVKTAGPDGKFAAELSLPVPGLYHIYADAVPAGHGQQVLRFDVTVGDSSIAEPEGEQPIERNGVLVAASGPYEVTVDVSHLGAMTESPLDIVITKDGQPADDLAPYLGVPLHAVLIRSDDLAYVHAHPTTDADLHAGHNEQQTAASVHHHGAGNPSAATPKMTLHLTPQGEGIYSLFLEFMGAGDVHTLWLPLNVTGAHQH